MSLLAAFAVGEGLKIGSSLLEGWMGEYEAEAQAMLAERNAIIAERNATARLRKAKFDQLRQAEAGERVIGRLTTQIGKSGVRADVGAPMRAVLDQAKELELENLMIGHRAQVEALQWKDKAAMYRYQGKLKQIEASNIKQGSLLSAFGLGVGAYGRGKKEGFF